MEGINGRDADQCDKVDKEERERQKEEESETGTTKEAEEGHNEGEDKDKDKDEDEDEDEDTDEERGRDAQKRVVLLPLAQRLGDCLEFATSASRDDKKSHHGDEKARVLNAPSSDATAAATDTKEMTLDERFALKIVDLGNACWTHKHFAQDIQTRQYRCPEVILGMTLILQQTCGLSRASSSNWHAVIFSSTLEPRSLEATVAMRITLHKMIELLGRMPRKMASNGADSRQFFNRKGELKHIRHLVLEAFGRPS